MENNFVDFPKDIHDALRELAEEYKIRLLKETHYETIDRELRWMTSNTIHRLNFDFSTKGSSVSVTYLIDKFHIPLARLLEWCHDYIPYFPYCAKITRKKLVDLPRGLSKDDYKKRIEEIIVEEKIVENLRGSQNNPR